MFHSLQTTCALSFPKFFFIATLALALSQGTAAWADDAPVAELLTPIGTWQNAKSLGTGAAVEGLAVDINTALLERGAKRLSFQDFDGQIHEAVLDKVEHPMDGATAWMGKVERWDGHSQVLLTTYQGAVSGYFDTPEGRYEILPRPGGHVLAKLDATRFAGCGSDAREDHDHPVPGRIAEQAARQLGLDLDEVYGAAAKAISILEISVLTTEAAMNAGGGAANAVVTALSSVMTLHSALVSSGVDAMAIFKGWVPVLADDLGDSSGGGDGLVLTLYSDGSGLTNSSDQQWHLNNPSLDGGAQAGDAFGEVLASGDFNGDLVEDLAIGIPGRDQGASNAGAVQILYGVQGGGLSSTNSAYFHQGSSGVPGSNEAGDHFGAALAAGDFNHDNYDDLAIGVPGEDDGFFYFDTGRIVILYGSSQGLTATGSALFDQDSSGIYGSNEPFDQFGTTLAVGHFDNDDYADLAVGVPGENSSTGRVAVLYGSSNGLSSSGDQSFKPGKSGLAGVGVPFTFFGTSLAAGDFDFDGYDELVVGAPVAVVSNKSDAGAIWVLPGSSSGLITSGSVSWSQANVGGEVESGDHFGWALASGDFDDDGYPDLAVGTPNEDSDDGLVQILFGSSSGLSTSGVQSLAGIDTDGRAGSSLATGDFDDDGYADLAVGGPGYDAYPGQSYEESRAGIVRIYDGSSSGLSSGSNWRQNKSGVKGDVEEDDELGASVVAGDFDGDQVADLAIGVPNEGVSDDSDYFLDWMMASDLVSNARTAHSSDLVGLIVENLDGYCGQAQDVLDDTSGDSTVFNQVTDRGCAVGNLTFAHEIGHLLGLAHDPANAGSSGACADSGGTVYSYGHFVNGVERSLMSYSNQCSSGCTRVALISNPAVDFSNGSPSGTSARDNSRCADITLPNVAAYN